MKKLLLTACWFSLVLGCGKSPDVTIQFNGVPITGSVATVYFLLQNVGTPVLDQNADGVGDLMQIPNTCAISTPSCGLPYTKGNILTLGSLASDYSYELYVFFRDSAGTVLFSGKTLFLNSAATPAVLVTLQAGSVSIP